MGETFDVAFREDIQVASKHMDRGLVSLIIKKCKLKPQWSIASRSLLEPVPKQNVTAAGEGVERRALMHRCGNVERELLLKTVPGFFKKTGFMYTLEKVQS